MRTICHISYQIYFTDFTFYSPHPVDKVLVCVHLLVSWRKLIARVQFAVCVAVPDTEHALVLVWMIICGTGGGVVRVEAVEERADRTEGLGGTEGGRRTHVHHDWGVGLGDLPTGDELASAREEVDLGVDELLELHDAQAHLGAARK